MGIIKKMDNKLQQECRKTGISNMADENVKRAVSLENTTLEQLFYFICMQEN